jgi:membrane-associated protease RseP (regulator of RpoE activity)
MEPWSVYKMATEVLAILVMIGILSLIILVHELGHYCVARYFGFQTPIFGFGLPFGPYWVMGRKWGTEFRLHACLLGGYVAIPELGDETNPEETFGVALAPLRKFPVWQRALVAAAGVAMNVLFAYLIMFCMFVTVGQPLQTTIVHALVKDNPIAATAGIQAGDAITYINGIMIDSPQDAVHKLTQHKLEPVTISVERQGKPVTFSLVTNKQGRVGMALISTGTICYRKVEGSILHVAGFAAERLWELTENMLDALGQTLASIFKMPGHQPGEPSTGLQDLHGVLAIVKIGADIAQHDWSQLFLFTVLISMDLAILNLIPWPALDGGHLAFMAIEAARGKPVSERTHGEITKWGFVSLLVLMAFVMVNDMSALFTGKLNYHTPKDESQTTIHSHQ